MAVRAGRGARDAAAMTVRGPWSRRRVMQALPSLVAGLLVPARLRGAAAAPSGAVAGPVGRPAPFSRFTDVAQSAGLDRSMVYGEGTKATYILENMGGGCAFFDYDNDGWMDIFIVGGRRLENTPADASNRLYKNNRDGTFSDVTVKAGLFDSGWGMGVCVGDYNNDGFEDLFVTYYGRNRLYRNNGDGTFTDVGARAGLAGGATQ